MSDLNSLNAEFSELELQQLEERLETDPLAVSGLINLNCNVEPELRGGCIIRTEDVCVGEWTD